MIRKIASFIICILTLPLQAQFIATDSLNLSAWKLQSNIQIITAEDIIENQYTSLAEVLNDQAGFFINEDYVNPDVSFRGENTGFQGKSSGIVFLIDGHDISFRTTGEKLMGIESFPITGVSRIEIIKGASAAAYIPGGKQVLVNIVPYSGKELNYISLQYKNRSIESSLIEASFGSQGKKTAFQLAFISGEMDRSRIGLQESPSQQLNQELSARFAGYEMFDTTSRNDFSNPVSLFMKLDNKFKKSKLSSSFYLNRIKSNAKFYEISPIYNNSVVSISQYYLNQVYTHSFLEDKLQWESRFQFDFGQYNKDYSLDLSPRIDQGYFYYPKTAYYDFNLGTQLKLNLNKLYMEAGFNFDMNRMDYLRFHLFNKNLKIREDENYSQIDDQLIIQQSYFLKAMYSPLEFLSLNAMGKILDHELFGNHFVYDAGVHLQTSKADYIKFHFNNDVRYPNYNILGSPGNVTPQFGLVASPNLLPEETQSMQLGLGTSKLRALSAYVDLYRYEVKSAFIQQMQLSNSNTELGWKYLNSSENKVRTGLEAGVQFKNKRWNTRLQYAFVQEDFSPKEITYEGLNLFPEHMLNASLSYDFKYVKPQVKLHYYSAFRPSEQNLYKLSSPYEIPSRFTMDLLITSMNLIELGKANAGGRRLMLSFKIKNLTGEKYSYPGYYGYDVPALGTNFWIQLRFSINTK